MTWALFRNNLLVHHEEQLSQMTSLCKQEMKLLMAIKNGNEVFTFNIRATVPSITSVYYLQDFDAYVKGLEEILSNKGRSILMLKAQIDNYQNSTSTLQKPE